MEPLKADYSSMTSGDSLAVNESGRRENGLAKAHPLLLR